MTPTRMFRAAALCAAAAFLLLAAPPVAAEDEVPYEVRRPIENLLKAKAAALLDERNADGVQFRRGTYSRTFHRVDDSTYTVSFNRDTAGKDDLVTERLLLTFEKEGDGNNWKLAKEEVQDSYQGLIRPVAGDEEFYRFDKFSFDREGMKVTASNGFLIKDFRKGKVAGFGVGSTDLAWDYVPPAPRDQRILKYLQRERAEDLTLRPDFVSFYCDAATCDQIITASAMNLSGASVDQFNDAFRRAYDKTQDDLKKQRKENPFGGFVLPDEVDHRYFTAVVGKLFPEKAIALAWDNFEPKEVTFWSSGIGPLFTYYSEETRKAKTNPYELETRDDSSARLYDLEGLRGSIELGLGEAETTVGDVTFTLATKRELREIPFFIARSRFRDERSAARDPQLFINSIQDGDGNELTWVKTSQASGIVVLPTKLPVHSQLVLRMQFENRGALFKLTSTYSYMDRGGWLPFVQPFDMIDDFDLTVKVPERYETLGIGSEVSRIVEDGVCTTRWISENPVGFPTIIFGVYVNEKSSVKATKEDGTEVPVVAHIDRDSLSNRRFFDVSEDGSDLGVAVADVGKIGPKVLGKLADEGANSINIYRAVFGIDYPFGKLDLVNDAIDLMGAFYGQAPSSIVFLGTAAFMGEGKVGTLTGAGGTKFTKGLVAHEVAHQWWGSRISNANSYNYWFVESLAEYSSALFVENVYGKKAYLDKVDEWRREILDTEVLSSVQDASVVWGEGRRAAMYSLGPYAFHVLRQTIGDEKFFRFLKAMAQELEGREIVTRDIQRAAEKALGGGMDWFFDQWIRGVGLPEVSVTYRVKANEDGSYQVEGKVDQRVLIGKKGDVAEGEFFQGIFPLTAELKSGKEARLPVVLKGTSTPFQFKLPERPKQVVALKYGEMLVKNLTVKQQ